MPGEWGIIILKIILLALMLPGQETLLLTTIKPLSPEMQTFGSTEWK